MKRSLPLLVIALAFAGCDSGGSAKQGPQTKRQDTPAGATAAQCERLTGAARDDCMRQTRESGTATPSVGSGVNAPVGSTGSAAPARAERGSGTEATNSAGTTSGNQQPLSTGGTSR